MAATTWDDIFLAGLGTWIPDLMSAEDAVAAGHLTDERRRRLGYLSLAVTEDMAPPDMAMEAGRKALVSSPVPPKAIGALLHASLWFQGLDIWPAASYVADGLGLRTTRSMDVQQRCNVGVSALELAAAQLATGLADDGAVVTTADRFAPPAVDRWNLHDLNMYGDGGTAMLLTRTGGFARLLSTASVADNALEGVTRGAAPLAPASPAATEPIDLVDRGHGYFAEHDETQTFIRFGRAMYMARQQVLKAAGLTIDDIAFVVSPASGEADKGQPLHQLLGVEPEQTTWDFGRTTGHIGAGDWAAGLEHLLTSGKVQPGQHVLLFGGGAGYTVTAAVLEITDPLP